MAVATLAAVVALLMLWLGPTGGDAAAHRYGIEAWRARGWTFWDNYWYSGRYSQVNYALIDYPIAATIGRIPALVGSVAIAAGGFASLVRRQWPHLAVWPSISAALLFPLAVLAGTDPFMLGFAFALLALVALQRRRPTLCIALAALAALGHPLALAFLVICLVGVACSNRTWVRDPRMLTIGCGVAAISALQYLSIRAFSDDAARYAFDPKDAAAIALFGTCVLLLARGLPELRALRGVVLAYLIVAAGALVFTSPLGGNVGRLVLLLGTPLLLIPLAALRFRPIWVVAPVICASVFWQVLPAIASWRYVHGARAPEARFWQPAIAFAEANRDANYRVEAVATADNWEAYYLARRGIPLARGWFRQDDYPVNAALYEDLTPATYQQWLRRTGVRYVLLPEDPLDPGGEAALLRAGTSGLRVAHRDGAWTIYELPNATPIVTPRGGAEVRSLSADRLSITVRRPGTYRIAVRYSPYWQIPTGWGCLSPAIPWGIQLTSTKSGVAELRFEVTAGALARTAFGRRDACPTGPET